jgi:glycosyltransferase involved in cell wall biosynthesis/tetratricopeptide (TPR) repeat protein
MNLAQLLEQLSPLEQRCAMEEMLTKALDLMSLATSGSPGEAYLNYVIGKALVGLGRFDKALIRLDLCLQVKPDHGHANYLLGYCFAQRCDWPGALAAQQRACGFSPQIPDAWYEQGRAALELGQYALAVAALEQAVQRRPGWQGAAALLHSARVQRELEGGGGGAAVLICEALSAHELPPQWLIMEWLELAGSLLLAGDFRQSRVLLEALACPRPSLACSGFPLPRRLALLLRVLTELLDPGPQALLQPWTSALRESLWLPPSAAEQRLWQPFVEPALWLLLARSGTQLEPAPLGRLVLDCLPAVEPAGLDTRELYSAIADRLPPLVQKGFEPFARRLREARSDLGSSSWLPEALAAGREQLLRQPSDGQVRQLLDQHLQALSQRMLDIPNRLVALPGQTSTALALRSQALAGLIGANAALAELDQQPAAPRKQGGRHRWLLLASGDLPQCVLYRVEQKRQQLERLGCQVRLLWREQLDSWAFTSDLLWAEAVVVCRLAATHTVLRAMAVAHRFGLSVYYDIDDLLFDPRHCPPELASYGGTLSSAMHRRFGLDVPLMEAAMRQADGLILSTPTLASRWQALHPDWGRPVWVLPNLAPPELWCQRIPPRPPGPGPLRLVVASGTKAHKQAWQEELAPALAALLARHDQLRLDLLGHLQLPEPLLPFVERIRCRPFTAYGHYLRQLASGDIGLVVLESGTFTDAKSAIRWMEFSLLGLASVLSPTATYTELLADGRDALFARGVDEWVQAVQQLIEDPVRRYALAQQAQAKAEDLCAPTRADVFWQGLIQAPPPQQAESRRRRLLVINVFFAPQSIGGATRVAQDQIRQLLNLAGDRYEVTILCVDHGPYQLCDDLDFAIDCHGWEGARVVRIAMPRKPWSWHFDGKVEAFCRDWFLYEEFDIIHAHCMQVLTSAPLSVARELGIPYIITLHDAWWLSPCLFLTTDEGKPVDPSDPLGHYDDLNAQSQDQIVADSRRRNDLEDILDGASLRIAVSEAFADVYRSAGVRDIEVIENDWETMACEHRKRTRLEHEPLRFCFVGGMAVHKGYCVLMAALNVVDLSKEGSGASLTVVDHRLQNREPYEMLVNGVTVRYVPPILMEDMSVFYSLHDVLLAPSIWPESFGLVTREALGAGLWVVASAIGALADPIQNGINGHAVPPGDPEALAMILAQLCRKHPIPQPLMQEKSKPNAIERLLPVYEKICGIHGDS